MKNEVFQLKEEVSDLLHVLFNNNSLFVCTLKQFKASETTSQSTVEEVNFFGRF